MVAQLRNRALEITKIWVDGVLADYCHKLNGSNHKTHNGHLEEMRRRKQQKQTLAKEQAMKKKDKSRGTEGATRQKRISEYFAMEQREL